MTSARILIVEDESIVALDLSNRLQDLGYTVVGQTDRGETALLKAEQLRPDLVLMDIQLKGEMDGIQAAGQIRARLFIPVIFLTAHADALSIQRAQPAEAYSYILKPFNEAALNSNIIIALYKHQMERQLRQSESRYRQLFETMAQGVVYQDAQGQIFSANPAAERILGLTLDQMLGRTSIDPRWRSIREDGADFPGEQHPAMDALRSGREATNVIMGVYNPQPDETVWIRINARPQFHPGEQSPYQVFTTFEDITAARRAESELHLLSQAVAQSANSVVITDPEGNIEYVNPKFVELTGYSLAEASGQNPRILKSGQQSQEFYQELWNTIKAGQEWRGEFHNRRKDGTMYWEEATIAPVFDSRGTIVHFIAIKENITARKQAEAEEKEQRQLAEALRNSAEALSSTLSFDGVLEQILDSVGQVVPYDAVTVTLIREGKLHHVRQRGWVERGWGEFISRTDLGVEDLPGLAGMLTSRELCLVAELPKLFNLSELAATHWVRSFAGIPICIRQQVIGFLGLSSARPNFYTAALAERLKAFASQAAVAIENARLFEQTHHYAITDGLTGLFNCRHFFDLALFEFERVRRYESDLSVIMLDVDHFKDINDVHGHPTGDEVLREIARRIQSGFRKVDIVARYGGEEFVAVMPETDLLAACQAAERVRKIIAETPFQAGGRSMSVTVSVGVAAINPDYADFNALIKAADDALYTAKAAGRNRIAWVGDINT